MTTTSALEAPVQPLNRQAVEPDPILKTLEQHARWNLAHRSFLKRMLAKLKEGELSPVDLKAVQQRKIKGQRMQQDLERFIAAHADTVWAHAYMKADAGPNAPQVA
jgi:hypothetical protein